MTIDVVGRRDGKSRDVTKSTMTFTQNRCIWLLTAMYGEYDSGCWCCRCVGVSVSKAPTFGIGLESPLCDSPNPDRATSYPRCWVVCQFHPSGAEDSRIRPHLNAPLLLLTTTPAIQHIWITYHLIVPDRPGQSPIRHTASQCDRSFHSPSAAVSSGRRPRPSGLTFPRETAAAAAVTTTMAVAMVTILSARGGFPTCSRGSSGSQHQA